VRQEFLSGGVTAGGLVGSKGTLRHTIFSPVVAPGIVSQLKQFSQHSFYALHTASQHSIDSFTEFIKSLFERVKALALIALCSKKLHRIAVYTNK